MKPTEPFANKSSSRTAATGNVIVMLPRDEFDSGKPSLILRANDGASAHVMARMNGPGRAGVAGACLPRPALYSGAALRRFPAALRPGLVEPTFQAGMQESRRGFDPPCRLGIDSLTH